LTFENLCAILFIKGGELVSDLYKRIKERREELGMTQDELAQAMGYTSRSSIAKIESGSIDIPQSKISGFAEVLKTTVAWLMGWDKKNQFEVSDKQLKFALFGEADADDELLEEVKRMARIAKQMKEERKNKK
jgi:transcriptional regulator with XRE-family HTH domain